MNKNRAQRSVGNIREPQLRFIFKEIVKYIDEVNDKSVEIEKKVNEPVDLNDIENWLQSKLAEQAITLNQMINKKFNEFNNTIWGYVSKINSFESINVWELNSKIDSILSLFNWLDKRISELENKPIPTIDITIDQDTTCVKKSEIKKKVKKTNTKKRTKKK